MKDKTTAAILAFFLGGVGAHKFYLGRAGTGLLYLVFCWTLIPGFLALIDFLILALMDQEEFHRRYNHALRPPVVVNVLPPPGGVPVHGPWVPYGAPASPPRNPGLDPEELGRRLEKLNELRISGLLSEAEFAAQKARLLE